MHSLFASGSVGKLNVCGPYIKRARLSHKPPMTQEQLAIKLQTLGWDIERFGISKIERGERQVADKELLMLAEAFSVKVGKLLGEN